MQAKNKYKNKIYRLNTTNKSNGSNGGNRSNGGNDTRQGLFTIMCINCRKDGHTFKDCKMPIISYGILAYKENERINDSFLFLLIQRRNTIGYIDFIRGKYTLYSIKNLVEEMTNNEKAILSTFSFDKIWNDVWLNHNSRPYIYEYDNAKRKFENKDVQNIIHDFSSRENKWNETEFGFAKGRVEGLENGLACAIREFSEETGYKPYEIDIEKDLDGNYITIQEIFYGSNNRPYKHVYYLAKMNTDRKPYIDKTNILQSGEICGIFWNDFKTCINLFRDYHSGKRSVLYKAMNIIKKSNT